MGFDLKGLADVVAVENRVARVVVAGLRGSSPREIGAAMLVWAGGQSGTIGGGALEFHAALAARAMLDSDNAQLSHHALGPDLGQCCGGAVSLLTEVYDLASVNNLSTEVISRPTGAGIAMPLSVKRVLATARGCGTQPEPQLLDGWMIEPVHHPKRNLWIWGAGHVGRALVDVLSPLPDLAVTWVDTASERFPSEVPEGVTVVPVDKPGDLVRHTPVDSEHFVLTYSHELDLELCHQLLRHGFSRAGLIGSATKWARFRSRLKALGHGIDLIDRIECPIGDPSLGKHPQMIAIGVASALLRPTMEMTTQKGLRA
jgi:xanthine dehydrogenase accessory factor